MGLLDGLNYHGRTVTIVWDRDGRRYGRGAGLALWIHGREVARSADLQRLQVRLPAPAQPAGVEIIP